MIDRRKGLSMWFRAGGEISMKILELGFDDSGDCRDFKVIVGGVVRGISLGEIKLRERDGIRGTI